MSRKNPLPASPFAGGGVRKVGLVPSPAKGRVRVGFFVGRNPLPASPFAVGGVRRVCLVPSPAKGRVRVGFS